MKTYPPGTRARLEYPQNRKASLHLDAAERAEAAEKRVAELEKHERILRESQQRTVDDLVRARDLAVRKLEGIVEQQTASFENGNVCPVHGRQVYFLCKTHHEEELAAARAAARLEGADAARREILNDPFYAPSRFGPSSISLEPFRARIEARLGKEPPRQGAKVVSDHCYNLPPGHDGACRLAPEADDGECVSDTRPCPHGITKGSHCSACIAQQRYEALLPEQWRRILVEVDASGLGLTPKKETPMHQTGHQYPVTLTAEQNERLQAYATRAGVSCHDALQTLVNRITRSTAEILAEPLPGELPEEKEKGE